MMMTGIPPLSEELVLLLLLSTLERRDADVSGLPLPVVEVALLPVAT